MHIDDVNKIDLDNILEAYLNSLLMFHHACDSNILNEHKLPKMQAELGINTDIPIVFAGISHSLCFDEPQYFFNKQVMNEVFNKLQDSNSNNEERLLGAVLSFQEQFFAAINSYSNIIDIYNDLSEASFEQELKTKIFRNPIYVQTVEDCLMNFYRCFLALLTLEAEKDYSNQNTLGKAIPVLKKYNFNESIQIDTDIRNSINHGNVFLSDNKIIFKFNEGGNYKTKSLDVWDYDRLINDVIDIAGGIIAGFIKFFSTNPILLTTLLASNVEENYKFEWFKLFYKSTNTQISFVSKADFREDQINVSLKTSIPDKNKLLMALIEVAKGTFFHFPTFERYLVGYSHNRSVNGFMSFSRSDFEALEGTSSDNAMLLSKSIENKECLIWDIEEGKVDERAYKFHVFPKIRGENWHLSKIADCSGVDFKRLKAHLIIEEKVTITDVKTIVKAAIAEMEKLKTPQNPFVSVPHGDVKADAIFLHVFKKSNDRQGFTLFLSNSNLICLAHFYRNSKVPRLDHGGVPKALWDEYRKEKNKEIEFAWHPRIKPKKIKIKGLTK